MPKTNDARSVTILVPMCPPSGNELRRKYRHPMAYKRLREVWSRTLWGLISGRDREWLEAEAMLGVKMRLEVCIQKRRFFDKDNAYASMKPVLDSLVGLKYLAGDDPGHLDLTVTQEKLNAKQTRIFIRESL